MFINKRLLKFGAFFVAVVMLFSACSKASVPTKPEGDSKKIKVLTTMYPLYDFAKKIAGDKADVENLVPTGSGAHGYEPSPTDIAKLESANIFVYNGAGMEDWTDKVVSSLSNKKLISVDSSKGADLIENDDKHDEHEHEDGDKHDHDHDHDDKDKHDEHNDKDEHKHDDKDNAKADKKDDHDDKNDHDHDEHDHGKYDPHIWLGVKNAKIQMSNIKDALVQADPSNKEYYEENYKKYAQEFDKLDEEYKTALKPYGGKSIVVSHEAFAYLVKDYDLKQLGIEGVYEESEPDPSKMKDIIEFVKSNKVKTIFFETLASPKVSETIAKETGAKTAVLNPLEGLTEDEIKNGKDYFSIMRDNLKALVESFK